MPRPTRRALATPLLTLALLGLAACGGEEAPAAPETSAGPTTEEPAVEEPAVEQPDVEGESLPQATIDPAELPDGFPATVPVVTGTVEISEPMDGGGFTVHVQTGHPAQILGPVLLGALDLMVDAGWAEDETASTPTNVVLTRDGEQTTVAAYPDEDGVVVSYLYGTSLS